MNIDVILKDRCGMCGFIFQASVPDWLFNDAEFDDFTLIIGYRSIN